MPFVYLLCVDASKTFIGKGQYRSETWGEVGDTRCSSPREQGKYQLSLVYAFLNNKLHSLISLFLLFCVFRKSVARMTFKTITYAQFDLGVPFHTEYRTELHRRSASFASFRIQ